MNLSNIVGDTTGVIHLMVSIIAMITGMFVLVTHKGTKRHKQIGYIYLASMILLNITAFMIYRLYGKFGLFHWMAVISLLTLAAGMYPILTRKSRNYIALHFNFMYWSVIGLYCAFMAETFLKLPKVVLNSTDEPMIIFYKMIGIATAITMGIGVFFFVKYKKKWEKQFE